MAKEVVIWCDRCMADDDRQPAKTHVVGINGKSYALDLCDRHEEGLLSPIVLLISESGVEVDTKGQAVPRTAISGDVRKGKPPASGERPWKCLWCENDYASLSGFTKHVRSIHRLGDGKTLGPILGDKCPLCGQDRISVLGQHALRSHQVDNATTLFTLAWEAADPHGVVSQRQALVPA